MDAIASYRGDSHNDYDEDFTFEVTFDDIFGGDTDAYEYKTASDVFYIKDTAGYYYGTNGNKYQRTSTTISNGVKVHKYKLNGGGDEIDEATATVARTANSGMKIKMSESVNGKTDGAMTGTNLYSGAVIKMIVIEDIPVDTKYTIKETLPTSTGTQPKLSLNSVTYFDSKSDGTNWNGTKTDDLTYTQVGSTDAYTTDNSDNITKVKMTVTVNGDAISQNEGALASYYNIAKRSLSSPATLNGADTRVNLVVGLGQAYLIIGKKVNHLYYYENDSDTANSDNPAGLLGTGLTVGGQMPETNDANGYQRATNANQTFLFKIDEYDDPSGSVSRTFYETIGFGTGDAVNTYKYRVIDADASHKYVVTEVTDWSWKYTGSAVSAEPTGNTKSDVTATVTVLTGTYTVTPIGGSSTEYSNAAKVEFDNTKNPDTRDVEGDTDIAENTATVA